MKTKDWKKKQESYKGNGIQSCHWRQGKSNRMNKR